MVRGSKPSEGRSRSHGMAAFAPDAMGGPRTGLHSGTPMPPAYCRMFYDARRILGLGEHDLAQRLATSVDTIRALESGQLSALPPWPETSRVVTAYLAGLGMDARPVLHSLAHDLAMLATVRPPVHGRGGPVAASRWSGVSHSASDPVQAPSRRPSTSSGGSVPATAAPLRWVTQLGRAPRTIAGAIGSAARSVKSECRRAAHRVARLASTHGAPVVVRPGKGARAGIAASVVVMLIAAVAQTSLAGSVMTAASAPLPATLTRAFGKVADIVRLQLAPVRDGLRWIEVEDPRSRRGDKLQTARR